MKLSAKKINEVWLNNQIKIDDNIGTAPDFLKVFISDLDTKSNISKIIAHFSSLKLNELFFDNNDYDWCFDESAYRVTTEAAYQFRLLQLLLNLGEVSEADIGTIVAREAITPGASVMPRVMLVDDISFIVFPLGWISQMYLVATAIVATKLGDRILMHNIINGFCVNIISEEIVYNFFDENPDYTLSPAEFSLLYESVSKHLIATHKDLLGSQIRPTEEYLTPLAEAITYGCEAFTLAHELAHILVEDHKLKSDMADEIKADKLAFDLLVGSSKTDVMPDVGIGLDGKPIFCAHAFLLIAHASMLVYSKLGFEPSQISELNMRTKVLADRINSFSLPADSEINLKRFDLLVGNFLKALNVEAELLATTKVEMMEMGSSELSRLMASHFKKN